MVALTTAPPWRLKKAGRSVPPPANEMRTGARAISMASLAAADRAHLPHIVARLVGVVAKVGLALSPGQVLVRIGSNAASWLPAQCAQPADIRNDVTRISKSVFAGHFRPAARAGSGRHALRHLEHGPGPAGAHVVDLVIRSRVFKYQQVGARHIA